MIEVDGVPTIENLKTSMPTEERMRKKAVAMHECYQDIPCDPCVHSCPTKAITMQTLVSTPVINHDLCNGCGLCVAACPGIAIFLLELKEDRGFITLAYEFLPLPEPGEIVDGLNRYGKVACEAKVERVYSLPGIDRKTKTSLVRISVPKEYLMEVRFFRRRE
jgi:Fe-S-cluster-containing hydrogenase component 2